MKLTRIGWDAFKALSLKDKAACMVEDGRDRHVLFAQQYTRARLEALGALATQIRFAAKTKSGSDFLKDLLADKRAMLYFTQPSTRTFLSFSGACQITGMGTGDVRDSTTSSEFKGESLEDSVRTFSSYFDCIVMRTREQGLAERMAWVLSNSERPVPIVNAGSGKDQHPTQALLDIYTLQRSFKGQGGIDGKRMVFVGDLKRGRTVRSLASLLTRYDGVRMVFVAPPSLQVEKDVLDELDAAGVTYDLTDDFEAAIPEADAIYMTRVQDEWDREKGESARIDVSAFWFQKQHLRLLKPDAILMHPLPRRNEISPEVDHDPRAMYWRQMRNGMWIRAALMACLFQRDQDVRAYGEKMGTG